MKLTQKTVAGLTLPKSRNEAIIFDDHLAGFGLRLRAGGSKTWVFQYKVGDKQRRVSLGTFPAIKPEQARNTAGKLHAEVRLGHDPAGEKAERRVRAAETMQAALEPFLARQKARLKPRSYVEVERHLLANSKPLHGLQLGKIDRRTIAARLTELVSDNGPRAADAVRGSLSTFFAWAIKEGLAESNPVIGTNTAQEADARDRVLDDSEVREIWQALEDDQYGAIVRLLTLTAQRREEIGGLCWSEVDFDNPTITLPPARTKNKRKHVLPLSASALGILKAQPHRTLGDSSPRDLLFGFGGGPFSGWSIAKKKLEAKITEGRMEKPLPHWTLHDLRRTAATRMADLGVQPHVIEAVLNHVSGHKSGVAGIYNRSTYEREKRQALELWADYVAAVAEGREGNVTPFKPA
jgi:integrase